MIHHQPSTPAADGSSAPPKTAFLHYTAPPVVGGVEAVIYAHTALFVQAGLPAAVLAGRGESSALPAGVEFLYFNEMDSIHPSVARINPALEQGDLPAEFDKLVGAFASALAPVLRDFDNVIVHNLFTKHFNLPLTAALHRLLDAGDLRGCIAWCHDFSWTSPNSRSKVHDGYPWDLLRTYREDVTYVTISAERQTDLAGLLGVPLDKVHVIYNGVEMGPLLGLSEPGLALAEELGFLQADINLLMPVRVTQAKNIELALHVVAALKEMGLRPSLALTGPPDPHDENSMAYFRGLQNLRRRLGVQAEMRFVFESGLTNGEGTAIDSQVVGELYRLADVMFMPSHREGFGMPILEAGLVGAQVIAARSVPAARELGGDNVLTFSTESSPEEIAGLIAAWAEDNPQHQLRRKVRQQFTWQSIFEKQIRPLLKGGGSAAGAR